MKFSNLKNPMPTKQTASTFKELTASSNEDMAAKQPPAYFSVPNIWSVFSLPSPPFPCWIS